MKIKYVLVFVLLILLCSCSPFEYELKQDIDSYEEYVQATRNSNIVMPELDNYESYDDVKVNYYFEIGGYDLHTISLIICFTDEEEYLSEKETVLKEFEFVNEDIIVYDKLALPKEFSYNGFTISPIDDEDFTYLSNFGMVGFDDENYKIVYMYIDNPEINHNPFNTTEEYLDFYFRFQ